MDWLDIAKQHLRIEHSDEDSLLTYYMAAAKSYAETFIGRELTAEDLEPGPILSGLLVHVAILYESREGEFIEKNLRAVKLLYWPYRKIAL